MSERKLNSLLDILTTSSEYLKKHGVPEHRLNAELLLSHILKCERLQLYLDFEKPLSTEEKETYKQYLRRRAAREPLQYITGETNFFGYSINVNPSVLIPRPETELLTEKLLNDIFTSKRTNVRILEIGTGSGCITVAVAKELEKKNISYEITSIDISSAALSAAQDNLIKNGLGKKNINLVCSDVLKDGFGSYNFDYLISNPPYVPTIDYQQTAEEILKYEPETAVTDKKDGLSHYINIFNDVSERKECKVFLEIGFGQKAPLTELLISNGISEFSFLKDYSGIDRILVLTV